MQVVRGWILELRWEDHGVNSAEFWWVALARSRSRAWVGSAGRLGLRRLSELGPEGGGG